MADLTRIEASKASGDESSKKSLHSAANFQDFLSEIATEGNVVGARGKLKRDDLGEEQQYLRNTVNCAAGAEALLMCLFLE